MTGWEPVDGTVWKAAVPNSLFGGFNPFAEEIDGDWIVYPEKLSPRKHLGDVYLNGHELLRGAEPRGGVGSAAADGGPRRLDRDDRPDPRPGADPATSGTPRSAPTRPRSGRTSRAPTRTEELVEINVRRSVFYPTEHHVDYITVRGFELAHAASPWAPPTADQPGLIGPNWAKGWIIEDNVIHDAKCSAVSLGKEASTGHNYATLRRDKPGYQYQLESVFAARQIGWDREHVGSHIVRRNTIYDCGQNGIVGHLGCVFSTIEDNHIYNIALKREFYGYEIAGIKLHAAIDVVIRHNRIHDCSLGTWLDWQTQGTRVSRNLFYANNRDLFVEVSHGPYLVDHNVFASPVVAGAVQPGRRVRQQPRVRHRAASTRSWSDRRPTTCRTAPRSPATPRSTAATTATSATSSSAATPPRPTGRRRASADGAGYGTAGYDGHPASLEDYLALVDDPTRGDHERFTDVKQPVYIRDNVYAPGAERVRGRARARSSSTARRQRRRRRRGRRGLPRDPAAGGVRPGPHRARHRRDLERVRFVDADFEEPDGSPASLDTDLVGDRKTDGQTYPAGPIAALASGCSRIRVW